MTVLPEQSQEFDMLFEAFQEGSQNLLDNRVTTVIKSSQMKIEEEQKKNPFTKRSAINRLSAALSAAPEVLTFSEKSDHKTKNPKNVVSGLGYGGLALGKGILEGISGILVEPVKGGMKQGAKGVFKGMGRGLIGVVAKPTAGVVGLVGCTV